MRTPFLLTCLLVATACGAQPKTAPAPLHAGKVLLLEHPGEMAAGLQQVLASCARSVTALDPFPTWEGTWEWIADPGDLGAKEGWAFREGPGWRTIGTGSPWQAQGIQYTGVAWYRRALRCVSTPAVPACLTLRGLEDSVAVFLNGTKVGSGGGNWGDLDVRLDGLRPGANILAIRVVNPAGSGDPNRGGLAGHTDLSVIVDTLDLADTDLVVISSRMLLSFWSAATLEDYVRTGGTVVALMHDAARMWEESPLERILPTYLGLSTPPVGMVRPVPVGPLGKTLGDQRDPVPVTAGIHLPDHPRFARPGTRETARWNLSPLAWDHQIEATGDDPPATPVLTSSHYGAGTVVACAAADLLEAPLLRVLLDSAKGARTAGTPPVGRVWSTGGIPWDHLRLQGLEPAEYEDADVVIVHGADSPERVRTAVRDGKTVLVLDPAVLDDAPDLNPWSSTIRTPPPAFPVVDPATWSQLKERGNPRVVRLDLPPDLRLQICVEGSPYGPVRGVWSPNEVGRRCGDGSWVIPASASLEVGLWTSGGAEAPRVHAGDRAIPITATGVRLSQPMRRPALRGTEREVRWRWEDGEPALACKKVGAGRVACFSVPLQWHNPRELDWGDIQGSKRRFHEEDTSQLLALAVRELASGDMLLGSFEASPEGITVGLKADVPRPVQVRYRFRDWQRSLLSSHRRDLSPTPSNSSITIPWPSEEECRYEASRQSLLWLEVAVVSPDHDRCLSRVEMAVRRPGPSLQVWFTPVTRRESSRRATWPRTSDPELPLEMGPAGQYPLFMPGEEILLTAESWEAEGDVKLKALDLVHGTAADLRELPLRRSSAPWQVARWQMTASEQSVYRIEADADQAVAYSCAIVSESTDLRSASWDRAKGMQVLGTLYPYWDGDQFAFENLCGHADSGLAWGPFARSWPGPPWCDFLPNPFCVLPNGVPYRVWISPTIRSLTRHTWTGELLTISASLVDGFNGVPWPSSFVQPQHLALFARWMRDQGEGDLTSLTSDSLATLVMGPMEDPWRFFVATEIALPAHRTMRDEIQAASPGSQITDQFDLPLIPTILRVPDVETFAESWQDLFSLSSSDAWNIRAGRDYHTATYLVSLGKALAPRGRIGHYHMEMLGGIGPERIAKAELIRRQNADLFWMMAASDDGWVPVETYADGGGVSWLGGWQTWLPLSSKSLRGGHVALPEDWGVLERLYATAEAIRPRLPRGFALAAVGPRRTDEAVILGDQARMFGMLRQAGLCISSMARLDKIGPNTRPDGLILPVPGPLSSPERDALRWCLDNGIPVGIMGMGLPERTVASFLGIPEARLRGPGVVLLRDGNVRGPFWPDGSMEDYAAVGDFVSAVRGQSVFDVVAPEGVSAYAFEGSFGLTLVLLEERGEARRVPVQLRFAGHVTRAAEVLEGISLEVRQLDRGPVIEVPLASNGAALVVIHD